MRSPFTQDLVLVGGGHSHAIALKKFGMNPLPGVRLTLITNVPQTPYSGMLPGYVAGFYTHQECHIDLRPLTNFAGVRMVLDDAVGLDLQNNRVLCADHPPIAFDCLSIDIGSTPSVVEIPGVKEYAIPVKPISQFLNRWDGLVEDVRAHPAEPTCMAVIGGGVGGVELALSAQAQLRHIYQDAGRPIRNLELHLFHRGYELMPERAPGVRRQVQRIMQERGIHLHLNETVSEIGPDWVRCESGLKVQCAHVFWVTQAAAAPWLREAGLATDNHGFVQVNDYLQSISHSQVFAAGDIAAMVNHPRPKAGVFAVRQGKPLAENLRRYLLAQQPERSHHANSLKPFRPQKEFLNLIGLGDRTAIAARDPFNLGPARWIWHWKDAIDRKFMAQFADLKPMDNMGSGGIKDNGGPTDSTAHRSVSESSASLMRCAGCGSKVGSSVLDHVLSRIRAERPAAHRDDILVGLETPDDAAVVSVPAGQVMVQTVDYFRALVDDPFVFGQIAANHCLSDLFAMGASPQSALAIATLPYAPNAKLEETLYHLLSGALKALHKAGAVLVGGHTSEGAELAFGLTCNGLAHPQELLRKNGMKPGQAVILTKPLGTGTLFAADMQLKAQGHWIEAAIRSMLRSNQAAADVFRAHQTTACTDITGFGLLGHLAEMVKASQVSVEIDIAAVPMLEGAMETIQQGYFSSLYPQNLKATSFIQNLDAIRQHPYFPLLFDPQTSGGLLAVVPIEKADDCIADLRSQGDLYSSVVGRTLPQSKDQASITILR